MEVKWRRRGSKLDSSHEWLARFFFASKETGLVAF